MNIEIKININKEFTETIQKNIGKIADKIIDFANIFQEVIITTESNNSGEAESDNSNNIDDNTPDNNSGINEASEVLNIEPVKSDTLNSSENNKPDNKEGEKINKKKEDKPDNKKEADKTNKKQEDKTNKKQEDKTNKKQEDKPDNKKVDNSKNTKKKRVKKREVSSPQSTSPSEIILNIIKKNNNGINIEDLKKESGFVSRRVSDIVYRLKKLQKIEKNEAGFYVAL